MVDSEHMWWIQSTCGGFRAHVVDSEHMWWIQSTCGGFRAHVVDSEHKSFTQLVPLILPIATQYGGSDSRAVRL